MTLITETAILQAFCSRQARAPYVTVDTEFLRDSTYWPRLCMVQLGGPQEVAARCEGKRCRAGRCGVASGMTSPLRDFKNSAEAIALAALMYARSPRSLRNVVLFERGIDVTQETARPWWNRFGPIFRAEIRRRGAARHRTDIQWGWHLDEVFVRINRDRCYLWRALDHEGEVLAVFVTKRRDRKAATTFPKRAMKRHGRPHTIVTDRLHSYRAAMREIGNASRQDRGCWQNDNSQTRAHRVDSTGRFIRRAVRVFSIAAFNVNVSKVSNGPAPAGSRFSTASVR